MRNYCAANERAKYGYCRYLRESVGLSPQTIDAATKAIARYEQFTGMADFRKFSITQIVAFKRHLSDQLSTKTGESLSKSTLQGTYRELNRFLAWLSNQPKYDSHNLMSLCQYLRLSLNESRIASARRESSFPSLEQVHAAIAAMPSNLLIQKRDRAVVCLALLTGARVSALCSLRLKHVDLENDRVHQDARDVRTKFRKTFSSYFFPVGDHVREMFKEWIETLRDQQGFSESDPVFPRCEIARSEGNLWQVVGLAKQPWTSSDQVRNIFRIAFERAGLPYFNPHSLRKTLVHLAQKMCRGDFEAMTAWSQNLGHEDIRTTIGSYGQVGSPRQSEIFSDLRAGKLPKALSESELELIGTLKELITTIKSR